MKIITFGGVIVGNLIPLHRLSPGSFGKVRKLTAEGIQRRRMLDLGLIYDTQVETLRKSPQGDPVVFDLRRTIIQPRIEETTTKIFKNSKNI